MEENNFDPAVFRVKAPPCGKCHEYNMDFKLFENFNGTGVDWVQWYCKHAHCGFFFNVEILM